MKPRDKYKTGFVTLYGQYAYLWMGQGLIDAPHTYLQFNDIVFGHFSKTQAASAQLTLVGNYSD